MRAQTAAEFLITYGWAIVVIGVIISALFSFGFFNPSTYSAQQCIVTSSFSCLNFFLISNGLLTVNLQQATSAAINVTALTCNQNGTISNMQKPYNPPTNSIFLPIGANYTFTVKCYTLAGPFSGNAVNPFSGYLVVNYTNQITKIPVTAFGKITVKVT